MELDKIIQRLKDKHGDKFEYPNLEKELNDWNSHITLICKKHGQIKQNIRSHLKSKEGCPKCSVDSTRLNIQEVLEKIYLVHNDKYKYPYIEKEYKQYFSDITLLCEKHGESKIVFRDHLRGTGCHECYIERITIPFKEIIKRSTKIHGDKYVIDENQTYNGYSEDIEIYCNECKKHFKHTVSAHLQGQGCLICAIENRKDTFESFKIKAEKIHQDDFGNPKFLYLDKNYTYSDEYLMITCKNHGEFPQTPNRHLIGHGCPYCKESKGEKEISRILNKLGIKFIRQYKNEKCVNKTKLPFDFYLPDYNICIEFDGRQHYQIVESFGGEEGFKRTKINDEIKNKYCQENDIRLFRIKYTENIEKEIKEILNFLSQL